MALSVRELIKESCSRVNIVPRRQAVPGDILETGYRLLRGIISKYNSADLLVWTQNSVIVPKSDNIHIYDEDDVLAGQYNMYFDTLDELNAYALSQEDMDNNVWAIVREQPNAYYTVTNSGTYLWKYNAVEEPWPQRYQEMVRYQNMTHMQVRDVAHINSLYVVSNANEPYREFYQLEFVNHTQFDKYSNTSKVFTYTQKSEGEWLIELKPYFYSGAYRLKLTYNEAVQFDIDSDLFIPDNYTELLIVALAHKLALQYPRLDDAQMQRLEKEVQVLVDNVRAPKAEDRVLNRNDYWEDYGTLTQQELLSGRYMV